MVVVCVADGFYLGEQAFQSRLKATFFTRRHLVGNGEGGEAHEGLIDLFKAFFKGNSGGRADRIGR